MDSGSNGNERCLKASSDTIAVFNHVVDNSICLS